MQMHVCENVYLLSEASLSVCRDTAHTSGEREREIEYKVPLALHVAASYLWSSTLIRLIAESAALVAIGLELKV